MLDALTIAPGLSLPLRYANRHALVTGATGTGKTVTLAAMAEGLAGAGVRVLAIDAKGDLESLGRVLCPYGERGDRAPLDLYRMGPDLIARALDLSEAQAGALYVLFAMNEAEGLGLATLADLKRLCDIAAADLGRVSALYGLVSRPSLAAVQRAALRLDPGAFGRPGFDVAKLGQGVTVWAASRMARNPALYGAAVAWLLLDLYDRAPEVGDRAAPLWAIVIDESHLIFEGTPPAIVRRLEAVARLIRSKGVALIWATQSPADLPANISGQCLTRIQHGLRAVTPLQARGVRAAAESMPQAEGFNAEAAIKSLAVGEALCSVPDGRGMPQLCQRVKITPGRTAPRRK